MCTIRRRLIIKIVSSEIGQPVVGRSNILLPALAPGIACDSLVQAVSPSLVYVRPGRALKQHAAAESGRRSVGLLSQVIAVRPTKPREVAAKVQFEVARNTVTNDADLGTRAFAPGMAKVEKSMRLLD